MPVCWRVSACGLELSEDGSLKRPRKALSAAEVRRRAERRAHSRCEYCHAPQQVCGYRFHLEHVIPVAEGGSDDLSNRALACASCNLAKGDRTTATDPETETEVPLFNPRTQSWEEYFQWDLDQETLLGLTPTGRATLAALDMNSTLRKKARELWFASGWLP